MPIFLLLNLERILIYQHFFYEKESTIFYSIKLSLDAEVVENFLTDRLGGKEAWRPTHFS